MEYIPDKVHTDNDNNNIYIIGIIVLVIIVIVCFFMNSGESLPNIPLNNKVQEILNYSLMVHLDDEVSEKRLNDVKEIYKNYDLPINLFKATHWKNDREELSKYPLNYIRITENNTRPGAYGLAGSFYKCLMKAYNENWPYLLFLEDDAVPILPPNQFNQRFNEVINTLPDNGSGLYNLGFAVYCKTSSNDNYKWIKSHDLNIYKTGTHCLLFGKNMIKIFTEYIKKNGINKPIDHIINDFNIWYWYGDLSLNGMFRGLFKQLYMNCNNAQSLEGPINDSKKTGKLKKIALCFLIYDKINHEELWYKYLKNINKNKYTIYIHYKQNKPLKYFEKFKINNCIETCWGCLSIVLAQNLILKEALKDKDNKHFIWLSGSCIPIKSFNYVYNFLDVNKSYYNMCSNDNLFPRANSILKYFDKKNIKKANMASIINRKHAELFLNNDNNIKRWFSSINNDDNILIKENKGYKYIIKVALDEIVYISLLHHYNLQNELILTYNIAADAIIFAQWSDMKNYKTFNNSIKENDYTYKYICNEELHYLINSKSLFARKFVEGCDGLNNLIELLN